MSLMGLLAFAYLANFPGLGIPDLALDPIPGVGNIDEGLATILLLRALSYFGIDLVSRRRKEDRVIDVDGQAR